MGKQIDAVRIFCCLLLASCGGLSLCLQAVAAQESRPFLLAHYMPWYASKPISGTWGWHWTMNHFDPDDISTDGKRDIAARHYPLIGPYDSNDPHLLEYHVLLMKIAGIDGAILDWYGTTPFRDYAAIHRNARHLVKHLKKAGLCFAICYEDQTVKHMLDGNALAWTQRREPGRAALTWLQENWFSDPAYVKRNGQPVLLVFGPQFYEQADWQQLFAPLSPRPLLFSLPHRYERSGADGIFTWPPVGSGTSQAVSSWAQRLRQQYAKAGSVPVIPCAFPGFDDIYREAGVQEGYGHIDPRGGATFGESLELALDSGSDIVQLVTWNDFGEGTIIEPTREFGYRYLEYLQTRRRMGAREFEFTSGDLRLPARLYRLRKTLPASEKATSELNRASELLFAGDCESARALLGSLEPRSQGK